MFFADFDVDNDILPYMTYMVTTYMLVKNEHMQDRRARPVRIMHSGHLEGQRSTYNTGRARPIHMIRSGHMGGSSGAHATKREAQNTTTFGMVSEALLVEHYLFACVWDSMGPRFVNRCLDSKRAANTHAQPDHYTQYTVDTMRESEQRSTCYAEDRPIQIIHNGHIGGLELIKAPGVLVLHSHFRVREVLSYYVFPCVYCVYVCSCG